MGRGRNPSNTSRKMLGFAIALFESLSSSQGSDPCYSLVHFHAGDHVIANLFDLVPMSCAVSDFHKLP